MIKRGMSFEFADTGPNAGETGFEAPTLHKLPFKMKKKFSGGDIEDIESGDPMQLMPRLRQIHKLGATISGIPSKTAPPSQPESKKPRKLSPSEKRKEVWRFVQKVGPAAGTVGGAAWGVKKGLRGGELSSKILEGVGTGTLIGAVPAMLDEGVEALQRLRQKTAAMIKQAVDGDHGIQDRYEFQGLPLSIENRAGTSRSGTDKDGHKWTTKMKYDYGFIEGTKAGDGDAVDVYVGPKEEAPAAYVVHQNKEDGKTYDEDKVMLGFPNKKDAKEAYLKHYDDPKFLGPISRVSMDRLRELVESKKKLVKISHASWMSMLRELQEMDVEKVAFGPAEAKRVLQIAKQRVVKVPRLKQTATRAAQEMMEGRMPQGLTFTEQALMQGGGAPMAVHPSAAAKLRQVVASGTVAEGAVPQTMIQGADRMRGRILTAKGGDATSRVRQHPMVGDVVQGPISQMTPEQRMMHNAVIKRHEMAELGINKKFRGPEPFSMGTGHMGAEAPLTDHTVLATLPKGNEPIREAVQGYRGAEANLLERATRGVGGRPGLEFGAEGQRLTRHARKRVGRRMEELAGQDLKEALADPDTGAALRQQFQAMGIKEIAGVGKLAAAPEEVVQAERRRLLRKAGPAAGALLGASVGAVRGMKRGKLLANVVGGLGTGATLGWLPDIVATAREARQRYHKVVK